jgi:hypothetical protein
MGPEADRTPPVRSPDKREARELGAWVAAMSGYGGKSESRERWKALESLMLGDFLKIDYAKMRVFEQDIVHDF